VSAPIAEPLAQRNNTRVLFVLQLQTAYAHPAHIVLLESTEVGVVILTLSLGKTRYVQLAVQHVHKTNLRARPVKETKIEFARLVEPVDQERRYDRRVPQQGTLTVEVVRLMSILESLLTHTILLMADVIGNAMKATRDIEPGGA